MLPCLSFFSLHTARQKLCGEKELIGMLMHMSVHQKSGISLQPPMNGKESCSKGRQERLSVTMVMYSCSLGRMPAVALISSDRDQTYRARTCYASSSQASVTVKGMEGTEDELRIAEEVYSTDSFQNLPSLNMYVYSLKKVDNTRVHVSFLLVKITETSLRWLIY